MHKALLLDLDGTVRKTAAGGPTPNHPDDQVVLPGRKAKIKAFKEKGYKIIAVTNQAGIELGYTTHEKVKRVLADLDHKLGYVFDGMYYAAGGINSPDPMRKPGTGMIDKAKEEHKLDLANSIMVGDKDTDEEAAKKAGVGAYFHAKDFFKEEEEVRTPKGAGWV